MMAQYLWTTGSGIIALMGLLHLRITLGTNKLFPRNEKLITDMESTSLQMTPRLTMWKSWIGFNATHGSGAAFIGITNFYLALNHFAFLKSSQFLLLLTLLAVGFYAWVAWKYWFKVVTILLLIAWACFIGAYVLAINGGL
ncbi:MAG: hypothetical protein J7623_05675 [Chitinophaga sp.]|uniref:LIC_13387 family protein n=1 Tax=Chitinophaga sp. TaxID=1869181 RepID=UPI001B0DC971|nr:hypothetical protein [Chitinophaga sp.]MBO9728110.1 hypothetical protein [Chitinophaga sp.]